MVTQTSQLWKLFWALIKLVHINNGDRQPKVPADQSGSLLCIYVAKLHLAPVLFLDSPVLHF